MGDMAVGEMAQRPIVYSTDPDAHTRDKRRKPTANKSNIQTLQARHRKIIELHVEGLKGTQIANYLGITQMNVSNVLGSEMGKAAIEQEIERQRLENNGSEGVIADAAAEALEVLKQGMTGVMKVEVKKEDGEEGETVIEEQVVGAGQRIRAAESFLDRFHPTAKVQRIQQQVTTAVDEGSMRELELRFASVMRARDDRGEKDELASSESSLVNNVGEIVEVKGSKKGHNLETLKGEPGGEAPQSLHEAEPREDTEN